VNSLKKYEKKAKEGRDGQEEFSNFKSKNVGLVKDSYNSSSDKKKPRNY
jgi:hypothetical protein